MLCLKAEALGREIYSASHGVILPVNIGGSVQKAMHKGGGRQGPSSSSSISGDGSASSYGFEDGKSIDDGKGTGKGETVGCYRFQLEKEVEILQKQLQEETDLHMALTNAVARNTEPILNSPSKIPNKALELLANITELEIVVSNLEEELAALHFRLRHERNECHQAETNLNCLPSLPLDLTSSIYGFMWEKHISSLRASNFGGGQSASSLQLDISSENEPSIPVTFDGLCENFPNKEISRSCERSKEEKEQAASLTQSESMDLEKSFSDNPNKLSEEMVRCMRSIFLCLSESSSNTSKGTSSESLLPSSYSPVGHLSQSSFTSCSDSSMIHSSTCTPSIESNQNCWEVDLDNTFGSYSVSGKVNWKNTGHYSLANEVSWMSVGKEQLEYAAEALKKFRFLVESLAKVNPGQMTNNEKLAFWINVYNALIMHAYLAYGVPRSGIKLFSLMQKASYTVGGQPFSAADIEFVHLRMKPPEHCPQTALILSIHKLKVSDEHRTYSIDVPEPLAVFALASGMYSSPAVRVFTAQNIQEELQQSMRDYIQASIGISDKGKLLVPKLLHCFARDIVEDSLLVDWICRYLTPDQVTIVRDSTSQKKQRLLGVRSFSIIPVDSRFRYLFLPDTRSSHDYS